MPEVSHLPGPTSLVPGAAEACAGGVKERGKEAAMEWPLAIVIVSLIFAVVVIVTTLISRPK